MDAEVRLGVAVSAVVRTSATLETLSRDQYDILRQTGNLGSGGHLAPSILSRRVFSAASLLKWSEAGDAIRGVTGLLIRPIGSPT
jgi:hypothetical protein